MKIKPSRKQITWGITVVIVALVCMAGYCLIFRGAGLVKAVGKVTSVLMSIIYGAVLAYVLSPVTNAIERHLLRPHYEKRGISLDAPSAGRYRRRMRHWSVFLTMLVFVLLLYGLLAMLLPQLFRSVVSIFQNVPVYVSNISHYLESAEEKQLTNPKVSREVNALFRQYAGKATDYVNAHILPNMASVMELVTGQIRRLVRGIFNWIVGFFAAIYMLNAKETFCAQGKMIAYALFPEKAANEVISGFRYIHHTFTGFFVGKIVDSIIIGILCYIGTRLIGTPYPELVSVLVGVTNVIPIFGPYIGGVAGGLLVLMIDPWEALYFLIFVIILQQFDGNYLGPRILGDSTGLSGFWVMFSIILFGGLFGVPGMLIGVPMFAVFYHAVAHLVGRGLHRKQMPTDTATYRQMAYYEDGEVHRIDDPESTRYRARQSSDHIRRALGMDRESTEKERGQSPRRSGRRSGRRHSRALRQGSAGNLESGQTQRSEEREEEKR